MTSPGTAAAEMPVYLDYQATTPVDPRVLDRMLPWFSDQFGNPHSRQHAWGWRAEAAVEEARAAVAAAIGGEAREIVFTSGATEANNLALKGALRFAREHGRGDHLVTVATEHKCVLESAATLAREGTRVTTVPVGADGLVDLDWLAAAIDATTVLVSVMAVNNEIGVIQPLGAIGALCREAGVLFHTDAAQAVGKIALDVGAADIDLLSISGHKLYGPKGIGALYVRRRPRARLAAEIDGGGQERGLRSGTLAPPLIVGLGTACAIGDGEMTDEAVRLAGLRDRFLAALAAAVPDLVVNGHAERRIAGNLNLAFAGIDGEALLNALPDVAISTGSACTSATVEPSYVLRALGLADALAGASIRVGFGRFTVAAEVDYAARRIGAAVVEQRAAEPVAAVAE